MSSATALTNRRSRPDRAPFFLLDRLAACALAAAVPVVLADGDQPRLRLSLRSNARALRTSSLRISSLVRQSWACSAVRLPSISLYHSGCSAKYFSGGSSG